MGQWAFVRPEATTNLVSNPSLETATTGYTASGGAIARSTSKQTKGLYSLAITPTAGVNDGVYYTLTLSTTTEYTFSVDVWGVSGIPYRIYFYDVTAGTMLGSAVEFTGDETWHRYQVTATTGANTSIRVYVEKNNHASTADFYIDALQVEALGYATTYCDGDEDGCLWAAGEHTSTSSRSAQSAAGGRVIDLDDSDYGFEVDSAIGVGMPPVEIIDTLPAQSDGADYQCTIARPRSFQLVGLIEGGSQSGLHTARLNLIRAFNQHRLATEQPIQLRYTMNQKSMAIDAYYEGGLEKESLPGPNIERPTLRFRAEDPLFKATTGHVNGDICGGQGALSASVRTSVANANYIIERDSGGVWQALTTGLNGTVNALAIGPDGRLYVGGAFTTAGGGAANRIAVWDPYLETWSTLGTGFDDEVAALAFGPDGTLYAGGIFTTADGNPIPYLSAWNGAAWTDIGTPSNSVYALAVGPDGTLYAGGIFGNIDAVANTLRIAKYNGVAWTAMGTGANAAVMALAVGADGTIYAGGLFTLMSAVANTAYVAAWDGSAWSALSTGMNATVSDLALGPDDTLYAGGDFTSAGGISASKIAEWNGTKWAALGTGLNGWTYSLLVDGGILYAGGAFTTAGGLTLPDKFAAWNGASWFALDVDLPGVATVTALAVMGGSLFVGYNTNGAATAAAVTSSGEVDNEGSANTYPILKGEGPGQFYQLKNYTTGEGIYFDLLLQDGETVTLDLRPGKKTFTSTFRGNIINTILEGSDVESFHLMPGANNISLFIDDATASAFLLWDVLHWSIDGVAA